MMLRDAVRLYGVVQAVRDWLREADHRDGRVTADELLDLARVLVEAYYPEAQHELRLVGELVATRINRRRPWYRRLLGRR